DSSMACLSNQSSGSDFILLDLLHSTPVPWVLFNFILLDFLVALFGNSTVIILIWADPLLHTPMYFLLSQLSLMDLLFISMFVPKMALVFLSGDHCISFVGCSFQIFLFATLGGSECLLLAVMAYDRYMAICQPLRYPILMRPRVCVLLVLVTWLGAFFNALIHAVYTLTFPYCASREIHHFFCEIPALLKVVCADTSQYEKGVFVSAVVFFIPPISAILGSYGRIMSTVLGMGSGQALRKTLATCSSHMTVVLLFYGAAITKYLLPKSYHSPVEEEVVPVFYTIITPMLNPLIYSLRNRDVTRDFRKVFRGRTRGNRPGGPQQVERAAGKPPRIPGLLGVSQSRCAGSDSPREGRSPRAQDERGHGEVGALTRGRKGDAVALRAEGAGAEGLQPVAAGMEGWGNTSARADFVLLGLFHHVRAPRALFAVICLVFLVTLVGNVTMMILIWSDSRLHTPMYFLLSQLSLMDLLYSSTFVPKIALDFLSGRNRISYAGCGVQLFLFMTLVGAECLLLAVMSYDRYVAICRPLHYSVLMRPAVCGLLVTGTWLGALLNASIHVAYTLTLPYCASREIQHFFCEIPALLKLVCVDPSLYEKGLYVSGVVFLLVPISAVMASYGQILSTVLGLGSRLGMRKALATCSSHMIVVCLFYGTAIFKYFLPKAYHTAEQDEVVSVFYTILTPMLNPLIYSLRNKEVAGALRKVLGR
ncbi:Olfactory receptor 2T27, partial [Galemys pyrenaicus]